MFPIELGLLVGLGGVVAGPHHRVRVRPTHRVPVRTDAANKRSARQHEL